MTIFPDYLTPRDSTKLSVLVADDDKSFLRLVTSTLQSLGHCVVSCENNVKIATKLAITHRPDIVIVGIASSPATGFLTAQAILLHDDVPIIACLEQADSETLARVAATNILGCLVKPFSPAQLESAICVAMAQHRRLQSMEIGPPIAEPNDAVANNSST